MQKPALPSRRRFLQQSGALSAAGAVGGSWLMNLAALSEAAAATGGPYKALVCVFLYGGNDYANTVVTYDDDSYNRYNTIRGGGAGQTAGGIALAVALVYPSPWELNKYRPDNLYPATVADKCQSVFYLRGRHLYGTNVVTSAGWPCTCSGAI